MDRVTLDSGIAQWRGGVEVRDEQPDLGPANYLFEAVTTVFSATLQVMIGDYKHFNLESYEILREEFQKFYLWNEGFSTSSGDLDQILSSSKNLKATVLNLMVSWVNAVLRIPKTLTYYDWSTILPKFAELEVLAQKVDQVARTTMIDRKSQYFKSYSLASEHSSDSDSDSESAASDLAFEDIIEDLNAYMESLVDLSPSLNHPALDTTRMEATNADLIDVLAGVSEPARPFVLGIQDRFSSLDIYLMQRLGEANWQRRRRLRDKLSAAIERQATRSVDDDNTSIGETIVGAEHRDIADDVTAIHSSIRPPSTFISTVTGSGFSEPSIFDRNSILIPHPQRHSIAESMTSFASSMADGLDYGRRRVPDLPDNYDFESSFQCQICGDILTRIRNRAEWKKHVYDDLEPYICLIDECNLGPRTFKSRKEWINHEFQTHRTYTEWHCNLCKVISTTKEALQDHLDRAHFHDIATSQIEEITFSSKRHIPRNAAAEVCPFCTTTVARTQREFASHVGKHQQEISLAALHNLDTSYDDGSSDSSDSSDDDDNDNNEESIDSDSRIGSSPDGDDKDDPRQLRNIGSSRTASYPSTGIISHELQQSNRIPDEELAPDAPTENEITLADASQKSMSRIHEMTRMHEASQLQSRSRAIGNLIDTELKYLKDLSLIVELYKKVACPVLKPHDTKAIFRNVVQIEDFTRVLFHDLCAASAGIYSRPQSKYALTPQMETISSSEENIISASFPLPVHENDYETHQKTSIGVTFGARLQELKTIYGDFMKRGAQAISCLAKLQAENTVKIWLAECDRASTEFTMHSNLLTLLTIPDHRIIFYKFILSDILDKTPTYFADYQPLKAAFHVIQQIIQDIDRLKRHTATVDKILSRDRKEFDLRSWLAKARSRQGSSAVLEAPSNDGLYVSLHEGFGDDYLRLQVVLRDIDNYKRAIRSWVVDLSRYLSAMELQMRFASPYAEIESKWIRFIMSMRDMETRFLEEHLSAVQHRVIKPLETVIQAYGPPALLMKERNELRPEYQKAVPLQAAGKKINPRLAELVNIYTDIDEVLKLELPRLRELTAKLGNLCSSQLAAIQAEWWKKWMQKLGDLGEMPTELESITSTFTRDYNLVIASLDNLAIIDGSSLEDGPIAGSSFPTSSKSQYGDLLRHVPGPSPSPPPATADLIQETSQFSEIGVSLPNFVELFRTDKPLPMPRFAGQSPTDPSAFSVLFLAASIYEFNVDFVKLEAGYSYLTYQAGEIFDVIGEKGELWLAKNQDDSSNKLGWIWRKHFVRLENDD